MAARGSASLLVLATSRSTVWTCPFLSPLPVLADGHGDPSATVNGAAVSVCVERAGPLATRQTVGRGPSPSPRPPRCRLSSRSPALPASLLPGRRGWPGWRLPPLPLRRADLGAGRMGGDDSPPRQVSVPSQGWVLRGGSELILGPAHRAGSVRGPQGSGPPCLPRPCSVTFVIMQ